MSVIKKIIKNVIPWNLRLAFKKELEARNKSQYFIPFDFFAQENLACLDEIQASLEKVFSLSCEWDFQVFRNEFEMKFAKRSRSPAALGVGSGTAALVFSLLALNVGKGDEVIVPVHTYISTILAILDTKATPVFVDVKEDLTINPDEVKQKISARTKAILPVHIYGYPADMPSIMKLANEYYLGVVEDACQGHATQIDGRPAGSWGDFGCFSFHWSKQIGAPGDGGMLTCRRQKDADKIMRFREPIYGDHSVCLSHRTPSRLSPMLIPFLAAKLGRLDKDRAKREELAGRYDAAFSGMRQIRLLPRPEAKHKHGWRNYTIRVEDREVFQKHLKKNGIETKVFYPECLHLRPELEGLKYQLGDFPVYEEAQKEIISLPFSQALEEQQVETVIQAVRDFYK